MTGKETTRDSRQTISCFVVLRNLITFEAGILNTLLCLLWLSFAASPATEWLDSGSHFHRVCLKHIAPVISGFFLYVQGLQDSETVRWVRSWALYIQATHAMAPESRLTWASGDSCLIFKAAMFCKPTWKPLIYTFIALCPDLQVAPPHAFHSYLRDLTRYLWRMGILRFALGFITTVIIGPVAAPAVERRPTSQEEKCHTGKVCIEVWLIAYARLVFSWQMFFCSPVHCGVSAWGILSRTDSWWLAGACSWPLRTSYDLFKAYLFSPVKVCPKAAVCIAYVSQLRPLIKYSIVSKLHCAPLGQFPTIFNFLALPVERRLVCANVNSWPQTNYTGVIDPLRPFWDPWMVLCFCGFLETASLCFCRSLTLSSQKSFAWRSQTSGSHTMQCPHKPSLYLLGSSFYRAGNSLDMQWRWC